MPKNNAARPVPAVFVVGLACACLLCGYEFVRSVSTSLFIGAYGADRLPIAMALMPVGVLLTLYGYGFLLSRLGPQRALLLTSLLSAAIILGCYAGVQSGWHPATGILYIFREAYIVVILEQFWSLINSTLRLEQAKKLNGPITGIASLGSIAGASSLSLFVQHTGSAAFLLYAAASLLPAALLSWLAYAWAGEPQPAPEEAGGRQGHLAVKLFAHSPYLVLLAVLIALTQVISTALDLRFSGLVEQAFASDDLRTAYLGGFWRNVNIVASLLQFVAAPILLHRLPLRAVHAGIPLIHVGAGLALLLYPSLRVGAAAFLLFKVLDYSLFRAGKEIFYIPLSFDVRYRAKEVIDAFVYRFSKGSLGLLLTLAKGVVGTLPGAVYPVVAVFSALAWLPIVLRLTRWQQKAE